MFTSYKITKSPEGIKFPKEELVEIPINTNLLDRNDYILEEIPVSIVNEKQEQKQPQISWSKPQTKIDWGQQAKNLKFEDLLKQIGANARITSAVRPGAKTKSGKQSYHAIEGGAYDIVPNDQDFNRLRQVLTTHPLSIAWFREHDKGILDETTKEMLAKTGGTGKHFHIGPDRIADRFWKTIQIARNGIKIKKENKGKFTEYCGGKVTNDCIKKGKNSSSSTIRKRATFADNVRKWKHKNGGIIRKFQHGGLPTYSELDVMQYRFPETQHSSKDLSKGMIKKISDVYEDYQNKQVLGFDLPIVGDGVDLAITEVPGPMQVIEGLGSIANMYDKGLTLENGRDAVSGILSFVPAITPYIEATNLIIDLSQNTAKNMNMASARKQILNNMTRALNIPGARLINVDKQSGDWQVAYPKTDVNGEIIYTLIKGKGLPNNPSSEQVNEYLTYQNQLNKRN